MRAQCLHSEPGGADVLGTVIAAFFDAVSFEPGQRAGYESLRHLFIPDGILMRCGPGEPRKWSASEFIGERLGVVEAGRLAWFHETELWHMCRIFGRVGHRLCAYEKRGILDGEAISAKGLISTQFIHTADGWKIVSMAWDDERDGLTLEDVALSVQ